MNRIAKRTARKYGFIISVWIYPVILFCIFYIGINFNSLLLAFQKIDAGGKASFAGFSNFKRLFEELTGDSNILRIAFKNSLIMYCVGILIGMPLTLTFSYYIFKKWFLNRTIRIIVMIPAIVSGFIMCLLFRKFVELALPNMMRQLMGNDFPQLLSNPAYSFGTVIFYTFWVGFSMSLILYPNAMAAVDLSVYESAKLDGVNSWQEMWHIILPNIYPTLSTFLILGVAGIFSASGPLFEFYMYSAPPEVYTVGYYIFRETMTNAGNETLYPYIASMGILLTAISVPMTFGVKFLLDKLDPVSEGKA